MVFSTIALTARKTLDDRSDILLNPHTHTHLWLKELVLD